MGVIVGLLSSGSLNCFRKVFLIFISTENGVSEITKLRLDVLTCPRNILDFKAGHSGIFFQSDSEVNLLNF